MNLRIDSHLPRRTLSPLDLDLGKICDDDEPMPSPIGHALGGVAAAWSAEHLPASPSGQESCGRISTALTLVCAVLAAAPDLDLLVPGFHRTVTHSVAAAVLVMIIAAGVTGWVTRRNRSCLWDVWRIAGICGLAYASHILLDWLGTDPNPPFGIQALWPFSHQWFIAGWTIFPVTERRSFFSWAALATNTKAVAVEVIILGPLVLGLGAFRAGGGRKGK
jgi:membrane-bound metal-dependent hydrolase YbcI (DUF457 family)